jgi:Rod binding domain-containing protein
MDVNLPLLNPAGPGEPAGHSPITKSADAAQQFEALLIGQLLRASHSEDSGWFGSGGDSTSGQATAIAEEFLARALASKGGLGIARMVSDGLERTGERPRSDSNQGPQPRPL